MSQRISENLFVHEFTCRCGCERWTCNALLVPVLEGARSHFGDRPLTITRLGGFRCNGNWKRADWNHHRGGADLSYHTTGSAADHYIKGVPLRDLYDYYVHTYPNSHGVILYGANGFVHVDCGFRKYHKIISHPPA